MKLKKGTEYAGGKPEVGVEPTDANFKQTRVGPASEVTAKSKSAQKDEDEDEVVKAEEEDAEEREMEGKGGKEDEEEEEEEEKARKSLTGFDLQKSLDKLAEFAERNDLPSRKEALLSKAADDSLNKSERDELFDLLGGEAVVADEPGESITKSLTENETLQKALDVSDYLQEQHTELVKSLRNVGEEIEKADHRRHEFNLVLAKAVKDIGEMVKSMSAEMGVISNKPAHAPKSLGVRGAQVMQKSFGGQAPAGEALTKSDVLNALDGLMEESMSKGMGGATEFGEDIALATAKYEQTHELSKSMFNTVKSFSQKQGVAR